MLVGLRIARARSERDMVLHCAIDAGRGEDHLKILDAPSSDEMSGRDVSFVACFDVATG